LNILQVITPSKVAGAERTTTSLCEHLKQRGHHVVVICKAGQPLIPLMKSVGLDVRALRIGGKLNVAAPLRIAQVARAEQVQVINAQLSSAALWGSIAGRIAGVPTVATVRALNTKTCYQLADRVIAVSQAVKSHLVRQGMDADRIDVVYNGIDPHRYHAALPPLEAKKQLGIPPDTLLCGVTAHLTVKKGHHAFLQAAATVSRSVPGVRFVLLGEGPERARLEALARELGIAEQVWFAGFHHDVLPFYAAMDVVVLPSIAGEGLPRVLLEASCLGKAVVGTAISGVPELVLDGQTGFIVRPGSHEALATRMRELLSNAELRQRFGAAARERVLTHFNVDMMVRQTESIYENVLADGGHRDPSTAPERQRTQNEFAAR
jgi:glycosyltransferase involved in cell wall biosynthesis